MTTSDYDFGDHTKKFKITPEFSLGAVTTLLSILISVISVTAYVGKIDARLDVTINRVENMEKVHETDRLQTTAASADTVRRLERIEDKLDRATIITSSQGIR